MLTVLKNMCSHNEWADAAHWQAFSTIPEALKDEALFKTLYHIHFVQFAFLTILRGDPLIIKRPADFPDPEMLKNFAIENHAALASLLFKTDPADLHSEVKIPWAKKEFSQVTRGKAFMQAFMHSHYHRAQNARRFRELGGTPPTTDYIMWCWQGEPEPLWK